MKSTHRNAALALWTTLACTGAGEPAVAQRLEQKLTPSDVASEDYFGRTIAAKGGVCFAGAFRDDDAGDSSGSAYAYRFDGVDWVEDQKVVASDASPNDYFGYAVAVDGDVAVVGAPQGDGVAGDTGAAYLYRYDGTVWVEEQKLTAFDGAFGDWFGASVALRGDVCTIGAIYQSAQGVWAGAVYVFREDGIAWIEEQKLTAADAAPWDHFGISVSIGGDDGRVIAVGAYRHDEACGGCPPGNFDCCESGAAYIFRYDSGVWTEEQKLVASDAAQNDLFGKSVATGGDVCVVGAVGDDGVALLSGSAYVYRFDGTAWNEEQKLTAADGLTGDTFGSSVCVAGNQLAVGASRGDSDLADTGAVYRFGFDGVTWVESEKIVATDGATADFFGGSVSMDGGVLAVGAVGDDDAGALAGAAYVFGVPPATFRRGDANVDDAVNISDAQYLLNLLFLGGPKSPCEAATDVNDDGQANIADAQYLLNHLFLGGPQPNAPYPDCGPDPESETLGCESSACE